VRKFSFHGDGNELVLRVDKPKNTSRGEKIQIHRAGVSLLREQLGEGIRKRCF
jgi:hypothetical protein